jgi:hypothetical protein
MKAAIVGTRGRAWTAAWLAASVTATTGITTGAARAQGRDGDATPSQNPARPPDNPVAQPIAAERPKPVSIEGKGVPRAITDWQEGDPVPPGYHPIQRIRKGAVIGGAVSFGVLYFISVLIAAAQQDTQNAVHGTDKSAAGLYIPVVGPFITMTQTSSAVGDVFLAIDGLGQGLGAALLIYGLTSPQTVLRRDDYFGRPRVVPQPLLFGHHGGGLGLTGTF